MRKAKVIPDLTFYILLISLSVIYISPDLSGQSLTMDFVKVDVVEANNVDQIYIENLMTFDVTVTLEMTLTNLAVSDTLPYTLTLRGKERKKVLELSVIDKSKPGRFESRYYYKIGNMYAEHDTTYIYQLPYKVGSSHKVVQSYFGRVSHDESSHYAVDFGMKEGTPVCAAREGVVVGVHESSEEGGPNEKYEKLTNYVLIRHSDLTIGGYYHLKNDGVLVRIGEKVERGRVIGYSGKTGFTFGPHLHFEVFKAIDGKRNQSFPIKFRTQQGIICQLIEGKAYIAK